MALSVSCTCCALINASAECCGYLCYPSTVKRLWPLWSNPVPLSLIRCTCIVPLFLRCCVICHMVLIALKREKVLWLPLRSYRLYNRLSQFRFDRSCDSHWDLIVCIIGYLNSDLTLITHENILKPVFIKFGSFIRSTSYSFSLYIRWRWGLGCRYSMLIIVTHVRTILILLRVIPLRIELDVRTAGYWFNG